MVPQSQHPVISKNFVVRVQLGAIAGRGYESFKTMVWNSTSHGWTSGLFYGKTSWVLQELSDAVVPVSVGNICYPSRLKVTGQYLLNPTQQDELHVRMRIRRAVPSMTNSLHSLTHELAHLKKSIERLESTLSLLHQPSMDMTRISFSSCDGTLKYLYAPSQSLLKYGYFQACKPGSLAFQKS